MNKFKKNDSVKVISGSYKGQTGRVLKIITKNNRVLVEGINKVKIWERSATAGVVA